MARRVYTSWATALVILMGCGGDGPAGTDGGTAGDSSAPRDDAGGADTGTPGADSGAVDSGGASDGDSGPGAPDSGPASDGAGGCVADVECSGYAAVLSAAPRGATSLDNCVVQLHQTDCCGAIDAYGVNHAARETLCPAEETCTATYPPAGACSDDAISTDTGETTTVMDDVRLRIVDPMPCSFDESVTCYTCETFVCTGGGCRTAPGIAGGCG